MPLEAQLQTVLSGGPDVKSNITKKVDIEVDNKVDIKENNKVDTEAKTVTQNRYRSRSPKDRDLFPDDDPWAKSIFYP